MIVKGFEMPLAIYKLKALEKRLNMGHSAKPDVKSELARRLAGHKGEQSLLYYLQQLPEKDYFIFHNLRLLLGEFYFQIDFLLLTTRFALILETKNIMGTLFFDSTFGQLIRMKDGEENGFHDPITQAKRQQEKLGGWLLKHCGLRISVEYFVVVSNPASIIRTDPGKAYLFQRVIHGDKLPERINGLNSKFKLDILDQRGVKRVCKLLLKSHPPAEYDALGRFGLSPSDICIGVQCGACGKLRMERVYGKWYCADCGNNDANAHITALKDYFYLIKPTITNQEFRDFMLLESPDVAHRLLNKMNLSFTGVYRHRIYYAPTEIESIGR
ncbi:NERD domain-containing protein [Bacillus sp. Y1]|nr:nuclease-related domain-containing protein [Bacillus sp. Y1]AYA77867.1 NERD domain-containing protein [Bacillus sp. Y1]